MVRLVLERPYQMRAASVQAGAGSSPRHRHFEFVALQAREIVARNNGNYEKGRAVWLQLWCNHRRGVGRRPP